jgi:DNA-binding response OmpR family regulator
MMRKRIVVIDDCRVTLAIVSDMLAEAGFQVATAEDSLYSNHLIYSSSPPDLILLDVMMPHMSGDKKLRRLREREKSRNIPVVLISSKGESELSTIAAAAGADGYLTKPFTGHQLVSTVQSFVS